ncbi:hypothetical protein [uncultured Cohaesibacter sp.]|uniref:hypothetical protein n=1 Tax=uncultured Cohaesibacter sp. TaxID=1002546 RepID=UPI0029C7FE5C|nr:hypothetical protein [uncultured Cohaesibacter sp.]
MKTYVYGLSLFGVLSAAIGTIYFYEAGPAFSLPQPRLTSLEQSLASSLKDDLGRSRLAKNWVEVKNCAITFRHQAPYSCSDGNDVRYSETRIDLHEVANIDYFETPNPGSDFQSSVTFEFNSDVQQRVNAAKAQFWEFLGNRGGATETLWSEHVIAAEQRILRTMAIDKLGSQLISGSCKNNTRYQRLLNVKHTLLFKDRDRDTAKKLKFYHEHCSAS